MTNIYGFNHTHIQGAAAQKAFFPFEGQISFFNTYVLDYSENENPEYFIHYWIMLMLHIY